MPILADVGIGPVFFLVGVLWGGMVFLLVVAVETVVLQRLKWGSLLRSLRDALIINIGSTMLGILMVIFLLIPGATLWSNIPIYTQEIILLFVSLALTIAAEAGLLHLLRSDPETSIWRAAAIINVVSYGLLLLLLLGLRLFG